MELTREEVEHIADLARLALTEAELTAYQAQLSAILGYFQTLQRVDTDDITGAASRAVGVVVAGTASTLALQNVLRPDVVTESLSRDDALANAPRRDAGQFRVDAVLE